MRHFLEQRAWTFIGKVHEFTENWVTVEGKGIVLVKGQLQPLDIDAEPRILMIPGENIDHVRVLPDEFDMSHIRAQIDGRRVMVKVDGGPDTCIGECEGD